jgi:hypothetical protein
MEPEDAIEAQIEAEEDDEDESWGTTDDDMSMDEEYYYDDEMEELGSLNRSLLATAAH